MGDPMTATAEFSALEIKYGNFVVPAMKIKMNGMDVISQLDLTVSEMQVKLSLDGASMVIIKIADAYDVKSHSFESKIKNKFKLGTITEIELGYLSSTSPVFKGYVAGLGAEMSESPLLLVKLMDVRKLMMTSGVKRILFEDENYSDVFKKVMGDYSKLCSVTCDATSDKLKSPISQSTNDYNFVKNELIKKGKSEREFFVLLDKAYFRTPGKNKTPIMTVHYGRELLEFTMMAEYLDTKIKVVGYDPVNFKEIVSDADAKSPEKQTSVLSPAPTQFFIDADADSESKASTRAKAIAAKMKDESCYAQGVLIGLPEIVPGRYIKVDKTDDLLDKKYYISEVTHNINESSFTTSFEAKGWI